MISVNAIKYQQGQSTEVIDNLVVEEMLNISINGEPYTTTMRTPGNEEALVRGILLTEQVYHNVENPKFFITEKNNLDFITKVNVIIPTQYLDEGINTKRNLMSVTSCGVCGKYEMELEMIGNKLVAQQEISPAQIQMMFVLMSKHQTAFKQTGGCHASAAFDAKGNLLAIHEDIGRHNAVDKVIGQLAMNNILSQAVCLLVSGRVSYEIVSKCYRAGIPYLAAVSAPSSMAVDYCKQKGIILFAFCREDKMTRYT